MSEYVRFQTIFLTPLPVIPALRSATIFALPRNHDVDCDATTPITWGGIRERNQGIYFTEDDEGRRVRKHRAEVFSGKPEEYAIARSFLTKLESVSRAPLNRIICVPGNHDMDRSRVGRVLEKPQHRYRILSRFPRLA